MTAVMLISLVVNARETINEKQDRSEKPGNDRYTISGYVKHAETGEELIGATVMVQGLLTGVATNVYGFYSLSLPTGTYDLIYSSIGFTPRNKTIELTSNQNIDIELDISELQLKLVTISAKKDGQDHASTEMSIEKMDIKLIKKLPQVLGEADILRTIQLLPGVSSVGEGAGGFNVRGGGIDQNLVLLDEATVYNSSHLFGFFSVFNADAIKDIKLYKGGVPARYGGRLSSVMDVRQKDGNSKKFSGVGGIGLLASRLTLEIPVIKNKSSLLISGRRSYMDLFLKASPDFRDNELYFYDLNVKANYKINKNNRVFLSGYIGQDVFQIGDLVKTGWGNATLALRWNHLFNEKLFSNLTTIYSKYDYSLGTPTGALAFDWKSSIINYNFKYDFSYYANPKNTIKVGAEVLVYTFKPGIIEGLGDASIFSDFKIEDKHAIEPSVYLSNEQKLSKKLTVNYGLRYSRYNRFGEANIYEYQNADPATSMAIDTTFYSDFETIKSYSGFEPRLAINYRINNKSSIKASYNRLRQYIHLVSNTNAPLPIDSWTPSGKYVKPSIVDQVAAGYFKDLKDNLYEVSTEVYYKNYQDLLDFKNGAQLFLNEAIETELLSGKGRSYGLEVMIKKTSGRFSGMISYTLSRTERQVEGINNGEYFLGNSDKLHDFSVIITYDLTNTWNISTNFVLMSGKPFTYPESRYEYEGLVVPNYSSRNAGRTPIYNRLDIGVNYAPLKKEAKKVQGSWAFGVYNAYARENTYSIFFRQNKDNPLKTEAVKLSVFGTVIPYITYNFKF